MRRVWAVLLALALSFAWGDAAWARRVALVIGNGAYAQAGPLANPGKDAALVGEALKRAGFETIDVKANLSVAGFRDTLREFQRRADGAEVALVYYAGHGIEAKGVNWLIPVDASLADERALPYEAISLDLVLEAVGGARMRVVMLDACRNSPFGQKWAAGTRSLSRGLARVETDDVLVVFAAAPGQQAADGEGGNSPFAKAVAQRLPQSGSPIQLLGGLIRDDVMAATGNQQRPFVSASISGTPFYLVPGTGEAAKTVASAPQTSEERAMWESAERIDSAAAYEAYLQQHPSGPHSGLARAALAKLETPKTGAETPPTPTGTTGAPPEAFQAARQLMLNGDYAGAEKAFAAFIAGEPQGPRLAEAYYWLAKCQRLRQAHDLAVKSFYTAASNYPQVRWAPDAMIELGKSLIALDRKPDACLAMRQFALHYPGVPAMFVERANTVRKQAGCSPQTMAAQPRPGGMRPGGQQQRLPGAPRPRFAGPGPRP